MNDPTCLVADDHPALPSRSRPTCPPTASTLSAQRPTDAGRCRSRRRRSPSSRSSISGCLALPAADPRASTRCLREPRLPSTPRTQTSASRRRCSTRARSRSCSRRRRSPTSSVRSRPRSAGTRTSTRRCDTTRPGATLTQRELDVLRTARRGAPARGDRPPARHQLRDRAEPPAQGVGPSRRDDAHTGGRNRTAPRPDRVTERSLGEPRCSPARGRLAFRRGPERHGRDRRAPARTARRRRRIPLDPRRRDRPLHGRAGRRQPAQRSDDGAHEHARFGVRSHRRGSGAPQFKPART